MYKSVGATDSVPATPSCTQTQTQTHAHDEHLARCPRPLRHRATTTHGDCGNGVAKFLNTEGSLAYFSRLTMFLDFSPLYSWVFRHSSKIVSDTLRDTKYDGCRVINGEHKHRANAKMLTFSRTAEIFFLVLLDAGVSASDNAFGVVATRAPSISRDWFELRHFVVRDPILTRALRPSTPFPVLSSVLTTRSSSLSALHYHERNIREEIKKSKLPFDFIQSLQQRQVVFLRWPLTSHLADRNKRLRVTLHGATMKEKNVVLPKFMKQLASPPLRTARG